MPSTDVSTIFAALADPTRRAILARLSKGEAPVKDLAEPFSLTGPAITKHLKVLERAGLISRSREGQQRPCRLEPKALAPAADWIEHHALALLTEQFADWTANRSRFPAPWREAAGVNDFALRLSPAQLEHLTAEIWDLLLRYRDEADPDQPDAEQVVVGYLAFPRPTR